MSESNYTPMVQDIMHYESEIWNIADLLIAASVKQSDFPAYMMPFFALVMLEGRMINAVRKVEEEEGISSTTDPEEFKEVFLEQDCGFNEYIVMQNKTLKDICRNDGTFEQDFSNYLKAFDPDLKMLLGIERNKDQQKYLNLDYYVSELRNKKILMQVVSAWSLINLAPYSNSDITTLEEHIKRKWADISATTAGEQYTPDDIISLIAEIVARKVNKPKDKYVHVYDPTCGGANLLFGVEDRLKKEAGYRYIATYGSEYNDALYALAAIESRFRERSKIHYGNTLTNVPFSDDRFDVIVANPPYGTKWTGYEKEVRADKIGQFPGGYPSTSDGQMLFMQHILYQLANTGIAVEVHNGSTLFSGDAGSGESNIRRYIFDHDWVEAIIQMPQQEFFNTGIYTYLWIMNKQKSPERKDKLMLIDGSNLWRLLKKSKGDKRREMTEEHRRKIVEALIDFKNCEIGKVYDKWHFYYNKQSLTLKDLSESGKSIDLGYGNNQPRAITHVKSLELNGQVISTFKSETREGLAATEATLKSFDSRTMPFRITVSNGTTYTFDADRNTLVETLPDGTENELGCGIITRKVSANKKEGVEIKFFMEPYFYTDYEIIPYSPDAEQNKEYISNFMKKYIFKPYYFSSKQSVPVVGVELNFNKEFYVPEKIESVEDVLKDIRNLNNQIFDFEL